MPFLLFFGLILIRIDHINAILILLRSDDGCCVRLRKESCVISKLLNNDSKMLPYFRRAMMLGELQMVSRDENPPSGGHSLAPLWPRHKYRWTLARTYSEDSDFHVGGILSMTRMMTSCANSWKTSLRHIFLGKILSCVPHVRWYLFAQESN